jgi:hypothetical protein
MKDTSKAKTNKCPFCTPENAADQCILATAKTVIDGKEYSACCSNREEESLKQKGRETNRKPTKR